MIARIFQDGCPFKRDGGTRVDLEDRFFPGCLMGKLPTHGLETVLRDDLRGAEVLELRRFGPGFLGPPASNPASKTEAGEIKCSSKPNSRARARPKSYLLIQSLATTW